jgi:hypothetical protein
LIFIAVPTVFVAVGFAVLILLVIVAAVRFVLWKKGKEPKRLARIARKVFLWGVTLGVLNIVILITWMPWVPAEKIAVKNGSQSKTVYGYVIGTQGNQTMVVNMKQTDVIWIGEDDLGERTICTASNGLREWYWQPAFAFLSKEKAQRPECGA